MKKTKKEVKSLFEIGLDKISDEEKDYILSIDPKALTKKQNDLIKDYIIKETLKIDEQIQKTNSLNLTLEAKNANDYERILRNEKKRRVNLIVGDYLKYELETVSRMLGTSLNETINILLEDRLKPIREMNSFNHWTSIIVYDEENFD